MTPTAFITKWRAVHLKERSAAQEHFLDLCHVLGEPTPAEVDPKGAWYCFERGASKLTGGNGWADVWKHGHFGWEYKSKHKDLQAAYVQLQQYAVALENPPLLVVCDLEQFRIHTNWTNTVQKVYDLTLDDLYEPDKCQVLKWVFSDPERLKPGKTRQHLTEEAAEQFASLAQRLRARGYAAHAVAHCINRLVFCMFAEDVGLLPNLMFTRMLEQAAVRPSEFVDMAQDLFRAMQGGGRIGFEHVERFNGGLFDTHEAFPLEKAEVELVLNAARLDWSAIDPSIFGTLFERGLDPDKRSQLGAHYTDHDKIMRLIEPVLIRPLHAEWEAAKLQIAQQMENARTAMAARTRDRAYNAAQSLHNTFLERLRYVRVLDPACGSGNFLYLALLALKDLEYRTNLDAEVLGLERQFPSVGPECVKGIEINPYAAELARVTVWIGEIQWMRRNGFDVARKPILRPLNTIECRDAMLNADGTEAEWPEAEFVVGNPPFLGGSKILRILGDEYVSQLRRVYGNRLSATADLVTYWLEKARSYIEAGRYKRVGFVATNSIRDQQQRKVLERLRETATIFNAWRDQPWVVEGAAVRVCLVCFGAKEAVFSREILSEGQPVEVIYPDLTGGNVEKGLDFSSVPSLMENAGAAFQGSQKIGAFDIPGDLARRWLQLPLNPNGRSNADVLKPSWIAIDLVRRPRDGWIIDFGLSMDESQAALYETPFAHVIEHVKPDRIRNNREAYRSSWWRHGEPRVAMRAAISKLDRYIATPETSKYRIFAWLYGNILPDKKLIVIARDDDAMFGLLHSRFHELWALKMGSWHGVGNDPRYTPSSTFETFPFPAGLTLDIPAVEYADDPRAQTIAATAKRLDELRNNWLNPSDLVMRVPEVVEGYPDRIVPKDEAAASILKKRTLTHLYNERPQWLLNAHHDLDVAVAAAYGWQPDMTDEEILSRLLALNGTRSHM